MGTTKKLASLTLGIHFWICGSAFATPAQVIIVRHGEKPEQGLELSERGCLRAFALPEFLEKNAEANRFGKPDAIYAAKQKHGKKKPGSIRMGQTAAPSAIKFGLPLYERYLETEYEELSKEVMSEPKYKDGTVVISWESGGIPELAEAFGVKLDARTAAWPEHVFDQAWIIRFSPDGKVKEFSIVPEHLLPGDNPVGGLDQWATTAHPVDPHPPCQPVPDANGALCTMEVLNTLRVNALSLDVRR